MYTLASYNVHVHLLVHEHLGFESWLLQINVVRTTCMDIYMHV